MRQLAFLSSLSVLLLGCDGQAETSSTMLLVEQDASITGDWQLEPQPMGRMYGGEAYAEGGSFRFDNDGTFAMRLDVGLGEGSENIVVGFDATGTWEMRGDQIALTATRTNGEVVEIVGSPQMRDRAEQRIAETVERANSRPRTETYAIETLTDTRLEMRDGSSALSLYRPAAR